MSNEDMRLKDWKLFPTEWENEQNTDAEALDAAQESANTNSVDSASVGEGSGISGESGGVSADSGAVSAAGMGAGAGEGAGTGAAASGGVGM